MRLLDNSLLGMLAAFAGSILLWGIQAELVVAQEGAQRASRYRFVSDADSKSTLFQPEADSFTAATEFRAEGRFKANVDSASGSGKRNLKSGSIRAANYLSSQEAWSQSERLWQGQEQGGGQPYAQQQQYDQPYGQEYSQPQRHQQYEHPYGQQQDQQYQQPYGREYGQQHGQQYDQPFGQQLNQPRGQQFDQAREEPVYPREERPDDTPGTFLDGFGEPEQFPFRDQFQAFPPRTGFGTLYGKPVGTPKVSRPSGAIFGIDPSEVCDEWGKFGPCVEADYTCGCGGLKADPRHRLFKPRRPSREPCDEALGCKLCSKPISSSKSDCADSGCRDKGCRKCRMGKKDVDYGNSSGL